MNETNTTEVTTETTAATTAPKRARKRAKTVAAAPKAKRVAKKAEGEAKVTKADLARAVFKRLSRGKTLDRQKILAALVEEAGLTEKGAATYYQTLKRQRDAGGEKAAA